MPGFNSHEMDDVHSPMSDYSFNPSAMMSSNSSGMFSFSQTGPADLNGPAWDAAAEGTQNFSEYPDHGDSQQGDAEEYPFSLGQMTPRRDHAETMDMDDFHNKWAANAAPEGDLPKAEPMRRNTSKSSTGSHKTRTMKATKKSRPRLAAALSQGTQVSKFDMTSSVSVFPDASVPDGRMMDPQQCLFSDPDVLSASHLSSEDFYPGIMALAADGIPPYTGLGAALTQHVDPTCAQMGMDFDSRNSPTQSWDSASTGHSRSPSPSFNADSWPAMVLPPSPTATQPNSPEFHNQSPRMDQAFGANMITVEDLNSALLADDDLSLSPTYKVRSQNGDSESGRDPRDHVLYKNAVPNPADGLFHCPWEGTSGCNHKPEKLKCNYDKFVDSHLKPYHCKVPSCENARFSSTACLLRHEREAHAMHGHGDKPHMCTYKGCERSIPGNGFPRQWNLRDHMKRVHNDIGGQLPGSGESSSPVIQPQVSSKGRKRKSDSSETKPATRKASSSATKSSLTTETATMAKAPAPGVSATQEWWEHQQALLNLVQGPHQPDDPKVLHYLTEAQKHIQAMSVVSAGLISAQQPDILSRDWQRTFSQNSG